MEERWKDIRTYLVFNITGKKKVSFKYYSMGDSWYNLTQEHLFAKNVKVIIVDDNTNVIYFEKEFRK